jgi:hypothetical protein
MSAIDFSAVRARMVEPQSTSLMLVEEEENEPWWIRGRLPENTAARASVVAGSLLSDSERRPAISDAFLNHFYERLKVRTRKTSTNQCCTVVRVENGRVTVAIKGKSETPSFQPSELIPAYRSRWGLQPGNQVLYLDPGSRRYQRGNIVGSWCDGYVVAPIGDASSRIEFQSRSSDLFDSLIPLIPERLAVLPPPGPNGYDLSGQPSLP